MKNGGKGERIRKQLARMRQNAFAEAGSTIASSSSDEDTVRFLPLAAGGGVTWGLEGDFFDDASANEEGRGRADETR